MTPHYQGLIKITEKSIPRDCHQILLLVLSELKQIS